MSDSGSGSIHGAAGIAVTVGRGADHVHVVVAPGHPSVEEEHAAWRRARGEPCVFCGVTADQEEQSWRTA